MIPRRGSETVTGQTLFHAHLINAQIDKIIDGKIAKYYEQNCLLEQEYIRDSDKKIKDLVTAMIAKLGENIVVKRFARFTIGE